MRVIAISAPQARRTMLAALAALLAIALVPRHVRAAMADLPPSVAQYSDAMNQLMKSRGRQSIEPIFALGITSTPGVQATIETLTDAEFKELQRQMPGFVLTRGAGENSAVWPSADYFKELARRKGTKADRAFFEIYARTEPDSNRGLPVYIRRQTGDTGCTIFDAHEIVAIYRGWLGFRAEFPDSYATEAQGELDSIDAELQSGTCACESKEKVIAALQAFVDAFHDHPLAPRIRERIAHIKAGTSHIRFNCKSS